MKNPFISIVVPIYKTEPYLKQCIESILSQTYTHFELILVDDGSPNGADTICDDYALKDERIRVIHKPNGGLVSARKAGTLEAKGDYITHIDSDDWILPDHLQVYVNAIEKNEPDVVSSIYYICNEENIGESVYGYDFLESGYYDISKIQKEIWPVMLSVPDQKTYIFGVPPSVWTKCVKRELAYKNTMEIPNEITMGEDVAWVYPCIYESSSIELIDATTYVYRINVASMTHTYDARIDTRLKVLTDYLYLFFKDVDVMRPQLMRYIRFLENISINNLLRYTDTDYATLQKSMQNFFLDENVKKLTKGMPYSKRERLIKKAVIQPFSLPLALLCKHWAKKRNK